MLEASTSLTIALDKGNHSYLFSVGRIGEFAFANWAYHQHDALGSVRQLTDADGAVTLSRSYMPYGDELSNNGVGASSYAFAGEWRDSTGLIFLRARYYSPTQGRFMSHDSWGGDNFQPMSFNAWLYGFGNPVMMTDPSGQKPWCPPGEDEECEDWLAPPDIINFNEKVRPLGIQFTPSGNYPKPVAMYKAKSVDEWVVNRRNIIAPGTDQAQFHVIGTVHQYQELCGPISLGLLLVLWQTCYHLF